ncbi:MAG: M20/M25/M40 family metallo-hydrolase [Pirellulales bacterium]|nr:M20/M25/M40 family metallo-hydrolase [Pirellulales bacterium]
MQRILVIIGWLLLWFVCPGENLKFCAQGADPAAPSATRHASHTVAKARTLLRESITTDELRGVIDFLADDALEGRDAGSAGGRAASSYLIQQCQRLKLRPAGTDGRYDQPFDGGMRNVLAVLPGADPEVRDEYVVLGAHYDHVGYGNRKNSNGPIGYIHNGADDNASGVASVLEVVQGLAELPQPPRRSILLAFWDGEEINLLGSKHWLANPTIPLRALKASVNIDMVGRLRDDRVEVYGTRTARGWRKLICQANQAADAELLLDFTWEMKADSDHHPFYAAGIPVVMLHTGLHDDYHRPSDDTDKLNYKGMERVTEHLAEVVWQLANELPISEFRSESREERPAQQAKLERPLPPLPGRLGLSWKENSDFSRGLTIAQVAPKGPAAQAGLTAGGVLHTWNGEPISSTEDFLRQVFTAPREVTVTWTPLPVPTKEPAAKADTPPPPSAVPQTVVITLVGDPVHWGLTWRVDSAEPESLLINRVIPFSPAALAGIQAGDRIYAVNDQAVEGSDWFEKQLDQPELEFTIERAGKFLLKKVTAWP